MNILVDGRRQEMRPLPETLGEVLEGLRAAISGAGKVVVKLTVDGREVDSEAETEMAAEPADHVGSVEVETAAPRDLCLNTLSEVNCHVQPIIDECARVSDLIDAGRDLEAFERILPCIEVWAAILSAVQKIALLMQVDIGSVATDQESLPQSIGALVALLQRLKDGIDARDLVAVRDVMKHEMPEVAARLSAQLDAMADVIKAK